MEQNLFEKSIYYSEAERENYYRNLFVEGVENGINSQIFLSLALFPALQEETFKVPTANLNPAVLDTLFERNRPLSMFKERAKEKIDYPEHTEVNFSYFLVHHGQLETLKKIISTEDNVPFVAPPYQKIRLKGDNGKEEIKVIFHDGHNGEPFTRKEGLDMIKKGLYVDFGNNALLKLFADNLPTYVKPIHANEVASQLRFLYNLDGRIKKMSEELFTERGINLRTAYPSIVPVDTHHNLKAKDIMGIGEDMDADFWQEVKTQRDRYTQDNKETLESNSANYATTVRNIHNDDGLSDEERQLAQQQASTTKRSSGGKR